MEPMSEAEVVEANRHLAKAWWLFLVTGIAWVLIAFVVLAWDPGTAALIGYLTGFVLIAAGVNELVAIGFVDRWKWLHGGLGAVFVIAGVMALVEPFQTFGVLALLIGWYLLFKGLADVIFSIVERDALHLWGILLASGIIEMIIGVWAIGYPGRSAWLLVLWVGIGALIRGITEIVFAFKLRSDRDHPHAALAVA
jgi:uncharacterized membrane protein HdeD (DUF308 family)